MGILADGALPHTEQRQATRAATFTLIMTRTPEQGGLTGGTKGATVPIWTRWRTQTRRG